MKLFCLFFFNPSNVKVYICRPYYQYLEYYCTFQNTQTLKCKSSYHKCIFSCHQSQLDMITSHEPWNRETHKTDQNPPITKHKPWSFEPVGVNFCFLRGLLRWLTAAKKANISWLLNFRIHVFMKRAVRASVVGHKDRQLRSIDLYLRPRQIWISLRKK